MDYNETNYLTNGAYKNNDTITFNYIGNYKEILLLPGEYQFECWGAQGGTGRQVNTMNYIYAGGKGGYSVGIISINKKTSLFVYVGGRGTDAPRYTGGAAGWNGGGLGGYETDENSGSAYNESGGGGGGSSDIRLSGGNWNNITSLRSRILVAAGGGGSSSDNSGRQYGSHGGGLIGGQQSPYSYGGTQTSGYSFGIGSDGFIETSTSRNYGGGGGHGGGYYGGYTGTIAADIGGAGGSSFISGLDGCNAIDSNGIHTNQPIHFSGLYFNNGQLTSGIREGNGLIKITVRKIIDTYYFIKKNDQFWYKQNEVISNTNKTSSNISMSDFYEYGMIHEEWGGGGTSGILFCLTQ